MSAAALDEATFHRWLCWAILASAAGVAAYLSLWPAAYGRHRRSGWGPEVDNRLGWILMEAPAPLVFIAVYALGQYRLNTAPLIFLAIWLTHYLYRAFVFPFRIRSTGKKMPVVIALSGVVFNSLNAYVNARWVSHLGSYDTAWLTTPSFGLGAMVFMGGWAINHHSDSILLNLRGPGEAGYKIPQGGMFRWISAPNYFGELVEWVGWAIATGSLPGLCFAIFTAANLAPRAWANHRWYQSKFKDYPPERRALLPGLW